MSTLQYMFRYVIYGMTIVILAIVIGDLSNRTDKDQLPEIPSVAFGRRPTDGPEPHQATELHASVNAETITNPYRERLERFKNFRSKVLLRDNESTEKERLLSDVKMIQWIESQLSALPENPKDGLGNHVTMINFLQEALEWKDNPARSDVLNSVERTLKVNNLQSGSKDARRLVAGDKMELFAVLARQAPDRARELLDKTADKQLSGVFRYAIKRLAIQNLPGEAE